MILAGIWNVLFWRHIYMYNIFNVKSISVQRTLLKYSSISKDKIPKYFSVRQVIFLVKNISNNTTLKHGAILRFRL